jgi:hypothetical protein
MILPLNNYLYWIESEGKRVKRRTADFQTLMHFRNDMKDLWSTKISLEVTREGLVEGICLPIDVLLKTCKFFDDVVRVLRNIFHSF